MRTRHGFRGLVLTAAALAAAVAGVALADDVGGSAFESADGALTACIASPPSATDVSGQLADPKGGGVRIVKTGESCGKDESRQTLASAASVARAAAAPQSQPPTAIFASKSVEFLDKTTVVSAKLPAGSFLVQSSVGLSPPDNGLAFSRVVSCSIVDPAGKEVAASKRTVTMAKGSDAPSVVLSTQALLAGTGAGDAELVCRRTKGGGRPLDAAGSISALEVQTDKADPSCAADSICFWSEPNYKGTLVTVASPSLGSDGRAGCDSLPAGTKALSVFSKLSSDYNVHLYPRGDGVTSIGGCSGDAPAVATFDRSGVGNPDLSGEAPVTAVFVLKKNEAAAEPPAPASRAKSRAKAKRR